MSLLVLMMMMMTLIIIIILIMTFIITIIIIIFGVLAPAPLCRCSGLLVWILPTDKTFFCLWVF